MPGSELIPIVHGGIIAQLGMRGDTIAEICFDGLTKEAR